MGYIDFSANMDSLKTLDLFSGIGGFHESNRLLTQKLNLDEPLFEIVAFCEIDSYCQKLLSDKYPTIPIFNDVRNITIDAIQYAGIQRIDAIFGGFPCQDLSSSNTNRKGLDGKRSGLFFEVIRLIRIFRPRIVLLENVANLLRMESGQHFSTVLRELSQCGYNAEWQVISAESVGAPHVRERVFIISYPNTNTN